MFKIKSAGWRAVSVFLIAGVCVAAGCATAKPLTLHENRRNLVILEDESLMLENEPIELDNLRQELVKRTINDRTAITLHVHENVAPEYFDEVYIGLKDEGFVNLRFKVYRD
jgi:biopolymer transport protein ExbD